MFDKTLVEPFQCLEGEPTELVEIIKKTSADAREAAELARRRPERPQNVSRQISDRSQASLDSNWFNNQPLNR
jgi:hypothetical protein